MKKILALSALAVVALAAPAGAQSTTGMGAMKYYVGTWSCNAGPVGRPASKATVTYTLDGGVMRQWVDVPAQASMKTPYLLSIATTYDAKKGRFFSTMLDNTASWSVSYAKPWTGNTEHWTDLTTDNGKPGHNTTVRTSQNSFSFAGYPTRTATKATFKGTCTRST